MKTYEDKYLREKVNRIIERQKEGQIVIAAYKDGSGLPSREDFGQELTRAAYPYDYAVGKAGFLKYDSELGAYLFTPKPGEKPPPCWQTIVPWSWQKPCSMCKKGESKSNAAKPASPSPVSRPGKGLYEVLRELNEELARVNAGIVVWKITSKEDGQTRPGDQALSRSGTQAAQRAGPGARHRLCL